MSTKYLLTDGSGNVKGSIFYDSAADEIRIASHDSQTPSNIDGYIAVSSSGLGGGSGVAGTFTPTPTGVTNVASASAVSGTYSRVGDIVTCAFRITVDPTATGNTVVAIPIPVGAAFTSANQASGACGRYSSTGVDQGAVQAFDTQVGVLVAFEASGTAESDVVGSFQYEVQ